MNQQIYHAYGSLNSQGEGMLDTKEAWQVRVDPILLFFFSFVLEDELPCRLISTPFGRYVHGKITWINAQVSFPTSFTYSLHIFA
jgi:hypothetical protein